MCNDEYYSKASTRAKNYGAVTAFDIIVFLEKEIDRYREKIDNMDAYIDGKHKRISELENLVHKMYGECVRPDEHTQLEAVQQIIKALSDNGYNTITINCYKDTESEEN